VYLAALIILMIYFADRINHSELRGMTDIHSEHIYKVVITIENPDNIRRLSQQYRLVNSYMPWVQHVYVCKYFQEPILGFDQFIDNNHISCSLHYYDSPGDMFGFLKMLEDEVDDKVYYIPLYDCIIPVNHMHHNIFWDKQNRRRCFGIDFLTGFPATDLHHQNICVLLHSDEIGQYQNIYHYLIGENVANKIIVSNFLVENLYLLQKKEMIQLDTNNWDRSFISIHKAVHYPENTIVHALMKK
jgi:hypothetical protein